MTHEAEKEVHEGRNVKRIREILGIKQDDLAIRMGLTQQAVSQLEAKESIDREILEKVSKALGISVDAIKRFNEEMAINIFSNTFNDHAVNMNYQCTFNPIEKWMEVVEENKKLYERLLQSEREKVHILESFNKK